MSKGLNRYSSKITQDESLPAAQAMLYGIGLSEQDLKKPQVGIVSTGYEGNTCNMHLNDLAQNIKQGMNQQELVGLIFHTIGVSDGISNGTEGMKYSLPSRDIIADSIETVVNAQHYDAVIPVVGCDKNMPGAMMALSRLNRPAILVYGGTIRSGKWKNENLNIISAFEAYGQKLSGKISLEDYKGIIKNACPGAGACGGMYTANTLASAIEALGMSLPYSSSNPATSQEKQYECQHLGAAIKNIMASDLKPLDIMTAAAFDNAITLVMALGGSTNAVLHLLAMAKASEVNLTLNDFQRISDKTPYLADLKPSGKYLMEDLHQVGGIPAVLKLLWQEGFIDGKCMTVTGKTMAENLEELPGLEQDQKLIHPIKNPIKKKGHIQVLFGNLAAQGAVAKITGKEGEYFEGPAKVYDDEFDAIDKIKAGEVVPGDVVVIRYAGPKGAPGMPEMLKITSAIMGAGLGKQVALITDGRFSGGSHGFVVGHICPEAISGGNIALVQNGDIIAIDAANNRIELKITDQELDQRRSAWQMPPLKVKKGILFKYYKLVSSASEGCVTDQ
ncbi:MAG: dihydroxy-acid dehydratase [Candidatus Cyclobacteriaceae bacterium M3_2C_046]